MTYQEAVATHGSKAEAARQLGIPVTTFKGRLDAELAGRSTPQKVVGESTLTDAEGNLVLKWTKTAADKSAMEAEFKRFIESRGVETGEWRGGVNGGATIS